MPIAPKRLMEVRDASAAGSPNEKGEQAERAPGAPGLPQLDHGGYLLDSISSTADTGGVEWRIESYGDHYNNWFEGLIEDQQDAVLARLDLLRRMGLATPRPTVDSVKGSRHHNRLI